MIADEKSDVPRVVLEIKSCENIFVHILIFVDALHGVTSLHSVRSPYCKTDLNIPTGVKCPISVPVNENVFKNAGPESRAREDT